MKCDHGKCPLTWDNFIVKKIVPNDLLHLTSIPSSVVEGKSFLLIQILQNIMPLTMSYILECLLREGRNLLAKISMTREGLQGPFIWKWAFVDQLMLMAKSEAFLAISNPKHICAMILGTSSMHISHLSSISTIMRWT
jgi:hypothetical protein